MRGEIERQGSVAESIRGNAIKHIRAERLKGKKTSGLTVRKTRPSGKSKRGGHGGKDKAKAEEGKSGSTKKGGMKWGGRTKWVTEKV